MAVVAPSGPVDSDRLELGSERIRRLGLDVRAGDHVTAHHRYLAGRDADRAADLQAAWCDPDIRAVICARGGYGAGRLLPLLDWDALAAAGPKLLHGSSDITALHMVFGDRLGLVTSFGPMPANLLLGGAEPDAESLDHLRRALFEPQSARRFRGTHALAGGTATGTLVGGNLSLLAAAIGTPWRPAPARGRLVLLEDVCEEAYRVDRMLTQLLHAGWLAGAAGIVLGSWEECGDDIEETLAERLRPLGVPILAGLPVGHGRPQLTMPLGIEATLDADRRLLIVDVPALA
ncbi:MAG: S66 peptidase family protein [Acidimicrobiales bacterium]